MPEFRVIHSVVAIFRRGSAALAILVLISSCVALRAGELAMQSYQVGAGGSFGRSDRLTEKNAFGGFLFTASWAQTRWLRWTGDGGFQFAGSPIQAVPPSGIPASGMARLDQMLADFHAGPEFTRPGEHVTVFAHVLPGYTQWSLGSMGEENRSSRVSEGGFSLAAGGGMDMHVRRHFDLRLQADYVPAWLHPSAADVGLSPPLPQNKSPYGNIRVAVVFLVTGIRHPR